MCTLDKRGDIFILTFTGDDQHRLNPTLITSVLSTLREVRSQATRGSVLITTSKGKFFSNGFDIAWAQAGGSKTKALERIHYMVESFKPVIAELISFPMPTIAAVQGHAAAAGFLLALSNDYFLMRSDKGLLYMSEIDMGLTFPDYFSSLFRAKLSSSARRDALLKAAKVKGQEAVSMGIADAAYDSEGSLEEAATRLGEQLALRKWDGDVYREIRKSLYPELCSVLGLGNAMPVAKL